MSNYRKKINPVLIIPTGLGCSIGGHAGDAMPVAKLIASVSDNLITHPNVVNASDINEMTDNTLYVEGSILDRFLEGEIGLRSPRSYNKILIAVNKPVTNDVINAISAGRITLGADIEIVELNTELMMKAGIKDGKASGVLSGVDALCNQLKDYDFDALGIVTKIDVEEKLALDYMNMEAGINPWGGVEARLSKILSTHFNKPVVHAPFGHTLDTFDEIVDPRKSAECVSVCYLHCILKGLHQAPQIGPRGLSVADVSCLITPINCWGKPHEACAKANIPIIAVNENKPYAKLTCQTDWDTLGSKNIIVVENYLEVIGVLSAMKAGIDYKSVRASFSITNVHKVKEVIV